MRRLLKIGAVAVATSCGFAFAEDAPAPIDAKDAAHPAQPAPPPSPPTKRDDCRTAVKQQGLKAQAASDQIQICLAQARLDCTKEAVAKAVPNANRRDYIRVCVSGDRIDR